MSERVVFGVFFDHDQWVISVRNRVFYEEDRSKALELAKTLNAREEELSRLRDYCGNELARSDFRTATEMRAELERLKAENAAQAAEIERMKKALKHQQSALMLLLDRQCHDGVVTVSSHDVRLGLKQTDAALADKGTK